MTDTRGAGAEIEPVTSGDCVLVDGGVCIGMAAGAIEDAGAEVPVID